ncbi:hypothetical protein ACQKP8_26255 [Photobacterium alginatilyticum]|uniref:hypothetical protein n=1 Tax=Photobacterium alginatilyticum TaxID=1775171 RepID=UPI00406826BC
MTDFCCFLKLNDPEKGEIVTCVDSFFPMTVKDLVKKDVINFELKAKVRYKTINGEEFVNKNEVVNFPVSFNTNLKVYALVDGGWLPPPFTIPSRFLIDRNILSAFENIQKGNEHYKDNCWWFDLFNGSKSKNGLKINTAFSAVEGEIKSLVEYESFKENVCNYNEIVSNQFDNVEIDCLSDSQLHFLYDFCKNNKYRESLNFMVKAMPLISSGVSKEKRVSVLDEIIGYAKEYNLSSNSNILILTIACLFESSRSQFQYARKILKPKKTHTKEMSHNSYFDMFFIDMLLLFKFSFDKGYSGVTADKSLAIYWSLITPLIEYDKSDFSYKIKLGLDVFEDASEEEFKYIIKQISRL